MMTVLLLGFGLFAADPPETAAAPAAPKAAAPKLEPAEALARYNEKKAQTPKTAAAQWKLAEWCEQNGLEAEAFVHYALVVQLDPKRDAAWRKLGFKKHQGRWVTDAQIADQAAQTKADKEWAPRLKKIHKNVHRGPKMQEALDELAAIEDPRAVPSVYREFGAKGAKDQVLALQVLGQIDTPLSSKVLALLAVYGKTPNVRTHATETLRRRNADDYLALLVSLMSDPLKYDVRPVGGPGSPGVLFVEGEQANVRRVYAPPVPSVNWKPGDIISYDASGMPMLIRPMETVASIPTGKHPNSINGAQNTIHMDLMATFSYGQMMAEAQRGAAAAQQQLAADVQAIEAINKAKTDFNEVVMNVARDAGGKDLGKDPKAWRDALAARGQYKKEPKSNPQKPTLDALVPLAYQPTFGELAFMRGPLIGDG